MGCYHSPNFEAKNSCTKTAIFRLPRPYEHPLWSFFLLRESTHKIQRLYEFGARFWCHTSSKRVHTPTHVELVIVCSPSKEPSHPNCTFKFGESMPSFCIQYFKLLF